MKIVFVYGNIVSMHSDVKPVVTTFEIITARAIVELARNDEHLEAVDEVLESLTWKQQQAILLILAEPNARALLDKLQAGERVHLLGEEELFGYGLTPDQAKLAFAEGEVVEEDLVD